MGVPMLYYCCANCLWTWLQQSPKAFTISCFVFFSPFLNLAAELGECELPEHTPELVSEFRFIPNQTEAMEFDIFQRWKECRYHLSFSCVSFVIYKCVSDSDVAAQLLWLKTIKL